MCGLITPFNFPMAIPTWKMFPALLCGNTVVLKPSEDVPHTSTLLVEVLLDRAPEVLETAYADDWRAAPDDAGRRRAVIDQVASLTDASAVAWHHRLVAAS